jgi:hypothetical protein
MVNTTTAKTTLPHQHVIFFILLKLNINNQPHRNNYLQSYSPSFIFFYPTLFSRTFFRSFFTSPVPVPMTCTYLYRLTEKDPAPALAHAKRLTPLLQMQTQLLRLLLPLLANSPALSLHGVTNVASASSNLPTAEKIFFATDLPSRTEKPCPKAPPSTTKPVSMTVLARPVLPTSRVAVPNQEQKVACRLLIQVEPKEVESRLAQSKDGTKSVALASLAQTLVGMTSSATPTTSLTATLWKKDPK